MGSLYLPVVGFDEQGQENLAYNRFSNKLLTNADLNRIFQYLQTLDPFYMINLSISEPAHKSITQKGLRTLTLDVNDVKVPIGKVVNCNDDAIVATLNKYHESGYMDLRGSSHVDNMGKEGECPPLDEIKKLLDEETKEVKKKQSEKLQESFLRLIEPDDDISSDEEPGPLKADLPDDIRTGPNTQPKNILLRPRKDILAAAKAIKDQKKAEEAKNRKGKNLELIRLRKQMEEDKKKEQKRQEAILKAQEADMKRMVAEQRKRMEQNKRQREENQQESEHQKRRKIFDEKAGKASQLERDKDLEKRYKEYIARKENRTSLKSAISSKSGHTKKKRQLAHIQREYLNLANNRDSQFVKDVEDMVSTLEKLIKDYEEPSPTGETETSTAATVTTTPKKKKSVKEKKAESEYEQFIQYEGRSLLNSTIDEDDDYFTVTYWIDELNKTVIDQLPPDSSVRKKAEATIGRLRNLIKDYTPETSTLTTTEKPPIEVYNKLLENDILDDDIGDKDEAQEIENILETLNRDVLEKIPPGTNERLRKEAERTKVKLTKNLHKYYTKNPRARPKSTPKKPSPTPKPKKHSSSSTPQNPPSSSSSSSSRPPAPVSKADSVKQKVKDVEAIELFETRERSLGSVIVNDEDLKNYRNLLEDVRNMFLKKLVAGQKRSPIEKRALSLEKKLGNVINVYVTLKNRSMPIYFDSPERRTNPPPPSQRDVHELSEAHALAQLAEMSGLTGSENLVSTTTTSAAPSTGVPTVIRSRAKQRTGTGRINKSKWDPEGPPPPDGDSSDSGDEGKYRPHRPSIPKGRGPYPQGTLVTGRPNPREDRGHLAEGDRPIHMKKWHRKGGHANEAAGSERYANDHKYRRQDETFEKNLPLRKKDMFNFLKTADYERAAKVIDDILLFKKTIPRGQITRNSNSGIQDVQKRNQLRDMYREYDDWRDKAMEFKNKVDRIKWRNYRYERNDKLKKQKGWKQNKSTSKSIWTDAIEQWNNLPNSTASGSNTIKRAWCVPLAGTEAYKRVMDIFEQIKSGQWDAQGKRVKVRRKRPEQIPDKNS